MMKAILKAFLAIAIAAATTACDYVDNTRIPWADVRIAFNSVAEWDTYGVPGAMAYCRFIKSERIPANYPYTSLTYTGFGGILLVSDVMGVPQAYDLACPVEVRYNCRLDINPATNLAECPECHSTFDVFVNLGAPITGPAAQKKLGLKRYHVGPGHAGEYMLVFP